MEKKLFYRVCHKDTLQGLWYDYKGLFTGKIHNEFDFCTHNKLKMDFDDKLVGWLSATESLETLYGWFPTYDILRLQKYGYYIHTFEATEYRFYDRFKHFVIKQDSSKPKQIITLGISVGVAKIPNVK
jgi:hypothetical protein